ncbi:MAG: bifunctional 2',3'-cyclic-nucleotide 2'-phosphodiesterase/3'-nucleotidase [Bacilli bacterium]
MQKNNVGKRLLTIALSSALAVSPLAFGAFGAKAEDNSGNVKLRLLSTTDLHAYIYDYDYYADKQDPTSGFARTATLIREARKEVPNSMLFDNGDTIQGNPFGDYNAVINPTKKGQVNAVFKAMATMNYDAMNLGNHEFNYGLDFINQITKDAPFPIINANLYQDDKDSNPENDKHLYDPYVILDRKVVDEAGKEHTIKVGVVGVLPPQVMKWDKSNLEGKVIAKDIVKTTDKYVKELKAKGADVVVAIAHSGFGDPVEEELKENAVYNMTKISGIDAIIFGHSHVSFPSAAFKDKPGVNLEKGTINGIPAVEALNWGKALGLIDLNLKKTDGKWKVVDHKAFVRDIYDNVAKKELAKPDSVVLESVKAEHEATVKYANSAVGKTTDDINSYLALVKDDPSIQIVTNAQKAYVEKRIKSTQYANLPVLSVGAPFKAGGRMGPDYYTNIPKGTLALRNVSDLYVYPNTVNAIVVKGKDIKEWLEMSAGQFNQIDPAKPEAQELVNNSFPTYNFDVIDGVTYQIDVTKPAKYNTQGGILNANSSRIVDLQFKGLPINPEQKFIVVTNNYRSNGTFPGVKEKSDTLVYQDENRQAIIEYINDKKTIVPTADNNWSFAPANAKALFTSGPASQAFAKKFTNITFNELRQDGYASYTLDLAKEKLDAKPKLVTVHALTSKSSSVSGTTDSNATVFVYVNNKVVAKTVTDAYGKYSLKLKTPFKKGTKLVVVAENALGLFGPKKAVVIKK